MSVRGKPNWSVPMSLDMPTHFRHCVLPLTNYNQTLIIHWCINIAENPLQKYQFHTYIHLTLAMASENPNMTLDPKYDDYDYPTTAPTKQSGHPGHLTPEQEAQVHQLRMMLEQRGYTERLDTLTLVGTQKSFRNHESY